MRPPGASAKGLTREGNENRGEIEKVVTDHPQAELAVFVFGNVDGGPIWGSNPGMRLARAA